MDCEKYDPLLLDELYDELDELTSAAVKRHVSGCTRCHAILQGMRSTRRAAVLPIVSPPADLEERILAAAREAQKVVPLRGRVASMVSRAGSWAMRPQTAMAAVFLLVIGASPFLIRSGRQASPSAVSVVVAGEPTPVAAAPVPAGDSLSGPAAAAAHGAGGPTITPPPEPNATGATGSAASGDTLARGAKRAKDDFGGDFGGSTKEERDDDAKRLAGASNAGPPAGAPATLAAAGKAPADLAEGNGDAFSAGMAAWRLRNFAEAQRQFETAAGTGDVNASLWAAKAVREGKDGPAVALGRFDAIAQRAQGTYQGAEAQLEAARCELSLGQLDAARARLQKLTGVSSHAAVAQKELEQVDQVAARRAASTSKGGSAGGGLAAPKAAARAPAAAATAAAEKAAPAKPAEASPRAGSGY